MRVNGIKLVGPGWTPKDPRFRILERLPPDVADMIKFAALDVDPAAIVYRLKAAKTPARTAYVDKHLAEAEAELWAEENGEPATGAVPTFH